MVLSSFGCRLGGLVGCVFAAFEFGFVSGFVAFKFDYVNRFFPSKFDSVSGLRLSIHCRLSERFVPVKFDSVSRLRL